MLEYSFFSVVIYLLSHRKRADCACLSCGYDELPRGHPGCLRHSDPCTVCVNSILVTTVLGQNGPWTKRTRQNGPRFSTKRTTSQDKTDHVSGQNGPCLWTKRPRLQDKTDHVLGQNGPRLRTNRTMLDGP